jgi:hypothetical protein
MTFSSRFLQCDFIRLAAAGRGRPVEKVSMPVEKTEPRGSVMQSVQNPEAGGPEMAIEGERLLDVNAPRDMAKLAQSTAFAPEPPHR